MNPSPENSHLLGYCHAREIGLLPSEEIRHHLTNVGFRDLNITVNEGKRWLCVTARK